MKLPDSLFVVSENPGSTVHIYDREKTDAPFSKDSYRTSLCGQSWGKESESRNPHGTNDVDCGTCLRLLEARR